LSLNLKGSENEKQIITAIDGLHFYLRLRYSSKGGFSSSGNENAFGCDAMLSFSSSGADGDVK